MHSSRGNIYPGSLGGVGFTQGVNKAFVKPTGIAHAGDGSQRIFVTERFHDHRGISSVLLPARRFFHGRLHTENDSFIERRYAFEQAQLDAMRYDPTLAA